MYCFQDLSSSFSFFGKKYRKTVETSVELIETTKLNSGSRIILKNYDHVSRMAVIYLQERNSFRDFGSNLRLRSREGA